MGNGSKPGPDAGLSRHDSPQLTRLTLPQGKLPLVCSPPFTNQNFVLITPTVHTYLLKKKPVSLWKLWLQCPAGSKHYIHRDEVSVINRRDDIILKLLEEKLLSIRISYQNNQTCIWALIMYHKCSIYLPYIQDIIYNNNLSLTTVE